MDEECPECGQDSMDWNSFGPEGGEYLCRNCGFTMRDNSFDRALEKSDQTTENEENIFKNYFFNNDDPNETIDKIISKYIKKLILSGDNNSTIKKKINSQLTAKDFHTPSNPNEYNSEIELMSKELKIDE